MQGAEAKNSEVWQGKGLSDFWCWEAALERSQRIPFELAMGILVLSVMVANGGTCMPMVLVIGLLMLTTVAISERVLGFLRRMNVGSGVQLAKDAPSVV